MCKIGPYLDANKVKKLPPTFGPGSLNITLRDTIQGCVDSVKSSEDDKHLKEVFKFLKGGNGQKVVKAFFDNKYNIRKMPHLNRESTFWSYVETFLHDLKCCPNLMSDKKLETICDNCSKTSNKSNNETEKPNCFDTNKVESKTDSIESVANVSVKRKSSFSDFNYTNTITTTPLGIPPVKSQKITKTVASNQVSDLSLSPTPSPQPKRATPVSVQSVRSPPQPQPLPPLSANPAEWSIDDVIRHLISVDASLETHAETFRKHVSLLRSNYCLSNRSNLM